MGCRIGKYLDTLVPTRRKDHVALAANEDQPADEYSETESHVWVLKALRIPARFLWLLPTRIFYRRSSACETSRGGGGGGDRREVTPRLQFASHGGWRRRLADGDCCRQNCWLTGCIGVYVLQVCVDLAFFAFRSHATVNLFTFALVQFLLFLALVFAPLIAWAFGSSLTRRLKARLKTFEEAILRGASIEVDRVDVNVIAGFVNIEGLVLRSPTGYRAPYLLKVRKAYAQFKMLAFLRSRGRHVEIECLELDCVDVIYERKGITSNLQELQKALNMPSDVLVVGLKRRKDEEGDSPQQGRQGKAADIGLCVGGREVSVTVHRCSITDLGARVQFAAIGGLGTRASLCDLQYDDLAKQLGTRPSWEISKALLGSILKTAITNVAGKSIGDRLL